MLAAGAVLLVGEVDVEPIYSFPFMGLFFTDLWVSPTFLIGLVFFVPAITMLAEAISGDHDDRWDRRRSVLFALLLVGCGIAKATILPVLIGGLVVTIAIGWWSTRRVTRNAALALAVTTAVFLAYHVAIYRHAAVGLGVDPFGGFGDMALVTELRASIGDALGWPLGVGSRDAFALRRVHRGTRRLRVAASRAGRHCAHAAPGDVRGAGWARSSSSTRRATARSSSATTASSAPPSSPPRGSCSSLRRGGLARGGPRYAR